MCTLFHFRSIHLRWSWAQRSWLCFWTLLIYGFGFGWWSFNIHLVQWHTLVTEVFLSPRCNILHSIASFWCGATCEIDLVVFGLLLTKCFWPLLHILWIFWLYWGWKISCNCMWTNVVSKLLDYLPLQSFTNWRTSHHHCLYGVCIVPNKLEINK